MNAILLNLILKLYPRAWRQRYEDEYRAMLEQLQLNWPFLFDIFISALDAHRVRVAHFSEESMSNSPQPMTSAKRNSPILTILYWLAVGFVALLFAFFTLLAVMVVPAPSESTAYDVSGTLLSITHPQAEGEDMGIRLTDGSSYYINRPLEIEYLELERLHEEVSPGDTINLTVVQPTAFRVLSSGGGIQPVAGVWTDSAVYMDPQISAETWQAQSTYERNAVICFVLLLILLVVPWLWKRRGGDGISAEVATL